jgi:hypothetical protein
MDLVTAFTGMQQAKLASQVQYAVAAKSMDVQRMQGAAAIQLLESASSGASKGGDAMVAAATGLGGSLDTYG